MAKNRRRKKNAKCPEPFNALINIASAAALGAVAQRMEKKYRYSRKGKINPYAVSAMGITSGRIKSTNDLIRTGGFLGAMGSFDVDAESPPNRATYVPEDPIFRHIQETKVNDNRYAWRMNCEDGSPIGVSPDDYETKESYQDAIHNAKSKTHVSAVTTQLESTPMHKESPDNLEHFIFCRISRLDTGENLFYLSKTRNVQVGKIVWVPTENSSTQGVVLSVEIYTSSTAPQSPDETPWIIEAKMGE